MPLKPADYHHLINELQGVIIDTLRLLDDFEETGMNQHMVNDYDHLHRILKTAIADQRRYQGELLTLLRKNS